MCLFPIFSVCLKFSMYNATSKYVQSHDEKTSVEFVLRSVYWRTMVLSLSDLIST